VLFLLGIAWVVGTVYASIPIFWLAIHPFTSFWQKQKRSAFRYLLPFWVLVIGVFLIITYPLFPQQLYHTWIALIPAGACFVVAISTYRRVSKDFGRAQVIGQAELEPAKHEQKLISTGIHSRIRHPFYLGHLLMLLAFTIGSGLVGLYVLTGVALITGALMIWQEERELERRFGEAYREYRRRVPAILPRPRARHEI
jgi:methanethiol S-methyltransferase